MSTEMQTKVQASPARNFSPAQTGLLQKKSALCNTPGLVEDSGRDKEKLTLQRSSVYQAGTTTVPRFGHDFSRVRIHDAAPTMIQTKLTIGQPNDIFEQEADRIADQVMAAPAHSTVSGAPPCIQRFSGQSNGQMDLVPASVDHALAGSGRQLEPSLRQDMEQHFGNDFSQVRVYTGGAAEQSAREVNANAYTVGQNIVFGAGRLAPGMHEGRKLLAHELTHVVQQTRGGAPTYIARKQTPWPAWHQEALAAIARIAGLSDGKPADIRWPAMVAYLCRLPRDRAQSLRNRLAPNAPSMVAGTDDFAVYVRNKFPAHHERLIAVLQLVNVGQRPSECEPSKPKQEQHAEAAKTKLNYDSFCDSEGNMTDDKAAMSMVQDWEQLDQVYADADTGNPRAKKIIQIIEHVYAQVGVNVAIKINKPSCKVPIVGDVLPSCKTNWSSIDYLLLDRPGGIRIRKVIFNAYEAKAQKLGIYWEIIGNTAVLLGVGIYVRGKLIETKALKSRLKEPEASALEGEARTGTKAGTKVVTPPEAALPLQSHPVFGRSGTSSGTVDLYHYGDLTGVKSFKSTVSYPRLTDYGAGTSRSEVALHTGTPNRPSLRYKYRIRIDPKYLIENFGSSTRFPYTEYGTNKVVQIPIKYFEKVRNLTPN